MGEFGDRQQEGGKGNKARRGQRWGWKAKKKWWQSQSAEGEKYWEILNFPPTVVPSSESSIWLRVWPRGDASAHPLTLLDFLNPHLFSTPKPPRALQHTTLS